MKRSTLMKKRFLTLAGVALAIASSLPAYATDGLQTPTISVPVTTTSGADAAATANPTVSPTISPVNTTSSGADAAAQAAGGNAASTLNAPINVAPVVTANPTSGADAAATINGGNTTVSPTITGGNSSATGGTASLNNAGNATLNGAVSGTNTLNGNVTGTNTNNVRNDLTNQVGVSSNNANLNNVNATTGNNVNTLNGGSVVDNSRTTNNVQGGATTATGTATVNVGDQVLHNITNVNASGGQGGKGGESSSTSSVNNSGNSHSVSGVTNSGNSQSGSSSSSTSQGGSVKDVGNVSGSGNSSVVINNPKPLPPAPGVVVPNSSAPTLFNQYGLPANAKGVDLALRFMRACPSTYVKGVTLHEVRGEGDSGLTNLIFTPHSNYAKYGNGKAVEEAQVVEIPENAKAGEHRYLCLGLIQSEARAKNASEVPIQTIVNDAVKFGGDNLKGFDKIDFVFIPKEALSVNMGLNADGKGFGISPGGAGMIGQMLATLAGGFSMNTGYTFPAAQLGGTFIVVAEGDFPDATAQIDFGSPAPVVSEAQKQLDAMKAELAKAQAETLAAKQAAEAAKLAQSEAEADRRIEQIESIPKPVHKKVKRVKKSPGKIICTPCKEK